MKSRRVEANLGAEREHFDKQQVRKENRNKHKGADSSCWGEDFQTNLRFIQACCGTVRVCAVITVYRIGHVSN